MTPRSSARCRRAAARPHLWLPALLLLLGCAGPASAQRFELVAGGLRQPVALAHTDEPGRLYVVEQGGTVRVVEDGTVLDQPFLDIRDRVAAGGERGLLGLAFPPDYAASGRVYLYYTDTSGTSTLSRFTRAPSGDVADPASERVLRRVPQPYANHNGGELAFGPDGLLYWGLGDGGSGGDPQGNGQNPGTPLGAILRIDVRGDEPTVPPDNPFAQGGGDPWVWVYGLRNPWRFSFDRVTGDLYIGDVGQGSYEEVDRLPAGSAGGVNFGWNVMEASHCFQPREGCDTSGLALPIAEYPHAPAWGTSITGGYVYRGARVASLQGAYLFADFGSGRVWTARQDGDRWRVALLSETGRNPSSFGEDAQGELYLLDYGEGAVLQLVP